MAKKSAPSSTTKILSIRVPNATAAAVRAAASREGVSVSDWLRARTDLPEPEEA